jgi:hypothetical protein
MEQLASPPQRFARAPARTGGRVLYLDFDGVLHPEDVWRRPGWGPYVASPPGHQLFEHADLLVELLAPYPDLRIVLSTSWVRVLNSVTKVALLARVVEPDQRIKCRLSCQNHSRRPSTKPRNCQPGCVG